jgi:hypothetical protein
MRRLLPLLFLVAALAAPTATAGAAPVTGGSGTTASAVLASPPIAARLRGSFRRPSYRPSYRSRPVYRPRYRRPGFGHFAGNVLRFLGIAYLANALFGWGSGGGSPFGLIIVVALIAWLVGRSSRRRRAYAYDRF